MSKYYIVGKNVLNKGYAVISDGVQVSITEGATTKEAIAGAIKALLEGMVPQNSEGLAPVMSTLYVADTVGKVLSHNTVGEWLRTRRTSKGNPLTEGELIAVRDAYIALTARNFNARVVAFGDMSNSDIAGKSMIQNAWAALDRHIATIAPQQMNLGLGTGLGAAPQAQVGGMDMNAMMAQMQQMQQMMAMMMGGQMPQMQPQAQPVVNPTVSPAPVAPETTTVVPPVATTGTVLPGATVAPGAVAPQITIAGTTVAPQPAPTSVEDILNRMGVQPRTDAQENTAEQAAPAPEAQEEYIDAE